MEIISRKLNEIRPYEKNPRKNDSAVEYVANSIKEFGFKVPIVIDKDGIIVCGHTRWKAAKKLGMKEVPCIMADDLSPEQIKAFRLADNKVSELAEWDFDLLSEELGGLDMDMTEFGFTDEDAKQEQESEGEQFRHCLQEEFVVPPFSVLDAAQGYWQERKQKLNNFLMSRQGRKHNLISDGLAALGQTKGFLENESTSSFDPVLCEVLLRWFCPVGGTVIDPFAGGSTRGCITTAIGNQYIGIDLSAEQIQADRETADRLDLDPVYINDNAENIDLYVEDGSADMVLTCPPYFDLEQYSDNQNDLSNMTYEGFCESYNAIIKKAANKLKDNRFMAVVISNVRDRKTGAYRNLVYETIRAMEEAGCLFYNEIILKRVIGTVALTAGNSMNISRKTGRIHENVIIGKKDAAQIEEFKKTHQITETHDNIMVGFKGNPKQIKNEFGPIDFSDLEIDALLNQEGDSHDRED